MSQKRVIVRGPALSRSGYGEQTRFALRALRSSEEVDVYLLNIPWGQTGWINEDDEERAWIDSLLIKTAVLMKEEEKPRFDYSLQVTIPNEFQNMANINIGYTAGIETTQVAPQWLQAINQMSHTIVVSNHSKNVFEKTNYSIHDEQKGGAQIGVLKSEKPIHVVNFPVKQYDGEESVELELEYDFNFLTVAQFGPRKNIINTIRWFVEACRDEEVGLVVKINHKNNSTPDRWGCKKTLKNLLKELGEHKCKVYLLHGNMSDKEIDSLYRHPKIKSYVSLTHGEGFGLPIFEAAYNGLPVIAPSWSGHCDFLYMPTKSKKSKRERVRPHFSKVDYTLGQIPNEAVWDEVLVKESSWCYPDEKSYKMRLKDAVKDISAKRALAKKLQSYVVKNFSEEKQQQKFLEAFFSADNKGGEDVESSVIF